MRILVTGSRDWVDKELLYEVLIDAHHTLANTDPDRYIREGLTIVTGACRTGADRIAEQWGHSQFGVEVETHPADWSTGRGAGIIRNHAMVDLGADRVLAFLMPCSKTDCKHYGEEGHMSHGATDCGLYAEARGHRVRWVRG